MCFSLKLEFTREEFLSLHFQYIILNSRQDLGTNHLLFFHHVYTYVLKAELSGAAPKSLANKTKTKSQKHMRGNRHCVKMALINQKLCTVPTLIQWTCAKSTIEHYLPTSHSVMTQNNLNVTQHCVHICDRATFCFFSWMYRP